MTRYTLEIIRKHDWVKRFSSPTSLIKRFDSIHESKDQTHLIVFEENKQKYQPVIIHIWQKMPLNHIQSLIDDEPIYKIIHKDFGLESKGLK